MLLFCTICIDQLPEENLVLASAESNIDIDDVSHYLVESLNTLNNASIPPQKLVLKKLRVLGWRIGFTTTSTALGWADIDHGNGNSIVV